MSASSSSSSSSSSTSSPKGASAVSERRTNLLNEEDEDEDEDDKNLEGLTMVGKMLEREGEDDDGGSGPGAPGSFLVAHGAAAKKARAAAAAEKAKAAEAKSLLAADGDTEALLNQLEASLSTVEIDNAPPSSSSSPPPSSSSSSSSAAAAEKTEIADDLADLLGDGADFDIDSYINAQDDGSGDGLFG